METRRQRSNGTLGALSPYAAGELFVGETLTPKQEKFAQVWASSGNQAKAYREAFDVGPDTTPGTMWSYASRLANEPKIAARFEELRQIALNSTIITIRDALQWQYDIATADPNDLVQVAVDACRHCHGVGFKYQWKDEDEFMNACIGAIDRKDDPPSDAGGYGFSPLRGPNAACPCCYGRGVECTVIADTTKLEGKARKLYAGVETDRYGVIKVKMHDQQAAWEKVCRMMGAFNDKLDLRTPAERAAAETRNKLPENVTAEEAARSYLSLLSITG